MLDEWDDIADLERQGHTYHCAARQVWGDGECECSGGGTDPGYHTMNPPLGGWSTRKAISAMSVDELRAEIEASGIDPTTATGRLRAVVRWLEKRTES